MFPPSCCRSMPWTCWCVTHRGACRQDGKTLCQNTFSNYTCVCNPAGYTTVTDRKTGQQTCLNINECQLTDVTLLDPKCTCDRCICIDTPGSYEYGPTCRHLPALHALTITPSDGQSAAGRLPAAAWSACSHVRMCMQVQVATLCTVSRGSGLCALCSPCLQGRSVQWMHYCCARPPHTPAGMHDQAVCS